MQSIKLGILGGGNMASALIRGLVTSQLLKPANILVSDVRPGALTALNDAYAVATASSNQEVVAWADALLVAVKPQAIAAILSDLQQGYHAEQLLISIAAGVPTAAYTSVLGETARVVRAMPNTPALVLQGATALAPGGSASSADIELATEIFQAVGMAVVLDESQLDAVTGLSGSGPGYVMLIAEALADAGVRMGLGRDVSVKLASQTLYGAAKLLLESGEHPATLKDRVASPGGTTITGLCALEANGLRHALIEAVTAATLKSRELGRASSPSTR